MKANFFEHMFSGIPQKNRVAAETYFDEHLSHNDYYTQQETEHGHWIGAGAEKLGLKPGGIVTRDAFLQLCDNHNPQTGEQLTPQNFKDRRIFFDFVCSPPKSVSILAVTMNDRRIVEAHKEASTLAIRELEQFAATRIRKGGIQERDRTTGNMIGAAFVHTTSRALDPQLHTHFVLFNSTWDKRENRWKALQTGAMFGAINYATEVYRNELAKRLHQIGYVTRKAANGFEIEGVEQKLIERFSKRSQQRDMAVKRQEAKLKRKLTKQEIAHVVHQSRPKKLKGASGVEVRAAQLGELGFFDKRNLRNVVEGADGKPKEFPNRVWSWQAVEHGVAHVFERNSVVPQHKILEAALIKGRGFVELKDLKAELKAKANLVRVGAEFSTREILEKELSLIHAVNAGIDAAAPFARRYQSPEHLGPDQRKALMHVLTSADQFTGFRGLAGSGKSTALVELSRVLHNEGFQPVFCAPTASAVDVLRKKDKLEAVTLAKLLSDPLTQSRLTPYSVVVLDEAGAVGLNDMAALFNLVRESGSRVVFSGDTGQHASVAQGDALRILEQYSDYRFSELTTIRRQKPEVFRKIVELAAAKQTDKAFAKLLELGAVSELSNDDGQLFQRAADAYVSATKEGKSALLVSPTWTEIEAVTEKVRETLKAKGVVSQQDEAVPVFDSLSWTEAQKNNISQYEAGQRLRFVRRTKQFDRGETVEVQAVLDQPGAGHNTLRVRRANGQEVLFKVGQGSALFDVGEARNLKVAAGDWLLLQANHGKDFINGQRAQVRAIQSGRITLTDGRELPRGYNAFTHGYAVTSHSSQGKTVDDVLLVASSKSFPAVNREQFYVSISRGRERVHVFTDDAELLAQRVTDTHERKAAIELQPLRDELAKLGYVRNNRRQESNTPPEAVARQHRPMRETRPMRHTRLSPAQRISNFLEDVRRWFGDVFQPSQQTKSVVEQAEAVKPTESMTPAERIIEVTKPRTVREAIRQRDAARRKRTQDTAPETPKHSRGIGI